MATRRALIPYHFGQHWDILPQRDSSWFVAPWDRLSDRLIRVSSMKPDLVVSGDCMAAIAAQRNGLNLVWYDAHGDFHTLTTSYTGSIGGMPLAMLAGLGDQSLLHLCGVEALTPNRITHVGGSDFDPLERETMEGLGVEITGSILQSRTVPNQSGPFHLHVDTDVISSLELPSSIHPSPRGMSTEKFWREMDLLIPWCDVFSIKSVDPRLDCDGRGRRLLEDLVNKFQGSRT